MGVRIFTANAPGTSEKRQSVCLTIREVLHGSDGVKLSRAVGLVVFSDHGR